VLSIGEPLPEIPPKKPKILKNTVAEALKFQNYLNEEPFRQNDGGFVLRRTRTYEEVARHFGVSCARVSQLMSILRQLPESFLDSMKNSSDPNLLTIFSGRQLIRISRLTTSEKRGEAISKLVQQ
jgi:DNA-directed RNA polymerase sigma subunit (sigma70/sigma32)